MEIILGSASPRRKQLLSEMGFQFSVLSSDIDESFEAGMDVYKVAPLIARRKAQSLQDRVLPGQLLICCDTVVMHRGRILGKPKNNAEAKQMIQMLSNDQHEVMSAVCLYMDGKFTQFMEITQVAFFDLGAEEVNYYVDNYNPLDKAGSYGIQEWIGSIAVKHIKGGYNNVIGLPTQQLYRELKKLEISPL